MWLKILLLSFYLFILFILSRIIEAFSYYQSGYLTSHLIDPFTLSVQKLKAILDNRGVSYSHVIEKQELSDLIDNSGELTHGEVTSLDLDSISLLESDDFSEARTINFSCGAHFLEKVEDTKDSVWLVQVLKTDIPRKGQKRIKNLQWKRLVKHLSRFGIQAGTFHCSSDSEFCNKKGWTKDEIILAMPEGYCSKDTVTMRTYLGNSTEYRAIFNWVSSELSLRVQKVTSNSRMKEYWLRYNRASHNNSRLNMNDHCWENVRVLLLTLLKVPPVFFSALSAKFSGRVKFGIVDKSSHEWQEMIDSIKGEVQLESEPSIKSENSTDAIKSSSSGFRASYLVITPEEIRKFGSKHGEHYHYKSLFSFLQSMHPEANDVFIISLVIISAACCFDFVFLSHLSLYRIVIGVLWSLLKCNLILIFCWLAVLRFFCSLDRENLILDFLLSCVRAISSSDSFNRMRSDWLCYLHLRNGWVVPLATLLAFYLLLFIAHRKCLTLFHWNSPTGQQVPLLGNMGFWETHVSSLLEPLFATSNGVADETSDFDDSQTSDYMMEMFIERLAMPDLWLRPIISTQYLHDLPIWRHAGGHGNGGLSNESDCSDESEDTCLSGPSVDDCSGNQLHIGPRPYIFICEKCRATLHPSKRDASSKSKSKEARDRQSSMRIDHLEAAKYLMDGNYKCMCRHVDQRDGSGEGLADNPFDRSHSQDEVPGESKCHYDADTDRDCTRPEASNQLDKNVPRGIIISSECSICLDSYERNDILCGLPCGHAYHQNCIMNWLTRDNHCCPVCRWPAYKAKPCHKHSR